MAERRVVVVPAGDRVLHFEASLSEDVRLGAREDLRGPDVSELWDQVQKFAAGAGDVVKALAPTSFSVTVEAGLEGETGSITAWVLGKAKGTASVSITIEWSAPSS